MLRPLRPIALLRKSQPTLSRLILVDHLQAKYTPSDSASSSSTFSTSVSKTGQQASSSRFQYPREWTKLEARPKYKTMATLETLNFDNVALRALPIDPQTENYVRQVSGACFSRVEPTPVDNPQTVAYSLPAMALIDLPESEMEREEFRQYLSGNEVFKGAQPSAHCYCGHQFGNFAGQLGDGATMYLGEVVNKKNERWEIQFKGAGITPYSRSADGRKVLRSSIREFLCSEAMHHLGIPTTRAGSCVTSDSKVIRDVFYTGNPIHERATIILRIAETFIRFGSFEIFKEADPLTGRRGPSAGRNDIKEQLLNYVVETFYSEIWSKHPEDKKAAYLDFYREIVKRTAYVVSEWQCVGWCHGVLNTDNMSIVGLTIDYGPYGFMDTFDPGHICNGSDDGGRYAYDQQPQMCKWNLEKLAEALAPLISSEETSSILETYDELYEKFYLDKMRKKLGLFKVSKPEDSELVKSFFDMLQKVGADMTNSFRCLKRLPLPGAKDAEQAKKEVTEYLLSQCCSVEELRKINAPKMDPRQLQMIMMLAQMNPELLQQLGRSAGVISKELERLEKTKELKNFTQEEKRNQDLEAWNAWLEQYDARLKEELKDVDDVESYRKERNTLMQNNNPRFILRNYIAQNAIQAAEDGDFSEVRRVLRLLESAYSDEADLSNVLAAADGQGASSSTHEENAGASASPACVERRGPVSCTGETYDSKAPIASAEIVVT